MNNVIVCVHLITCIIRNIYNNIYPFMLCYPSCLYMYVSIYIRRARVYSTQTGFSIDIIVCAFVNHQQLAILLIID